MCAKYMKHDAKLETQGMHTIHMKAETTVDKWLRNWKNEKQISGSGMSRWSGYSNMQICKCWSGYVRVS